MFKICQGFEAESVIPKIEYRNLEFVLRLCCACATIKLVRQPK
nr:MAG TPA: hypothetical protein [Caudoviricetes sp.]